MKGAAAREPSGSRTMLHETGLKPLAPGNTARPTRRQHLDGAATKWVTSWTPAALYSLTPEVVSDDALLPLGEVQNGAKKFFEP